jgi:AcrR family transcriptional regulator
VAYLSFEERRRRIIDAAVEVLATEGLDRLTTRRIADRAEAPLGSLHYCFRNKEELITLVAERGTEMLQLSFHDVDPSRGLEATIRDSVAAMWRWYQDNIGLQLALMELGLARIRRGGDPAEVYAMWDPFGRELLHALLAQAATDEGVKPAVDVDEIVRFILHRFDGLAYEYGASRDDAACSRQVDLLADALVMLALPGSKPKSVGRAARSKSSSTPKKATKQAARRTPAKKAASTRR